MSAERALSRLGRLPRGADAQGAGIEPAGSESAATPGGRRASLRAACQCACVVGLDLDARAAGGGGGGAELNSAATAMLSTSGANCSATSLSILRTWMVRRSLAGRGPYYQGRLMAVAAHGRVACAPTRTLHCAASIE